jgi:hypothetical protein
MTVRLTVRLRTTGETVALDATGKATALRHTYDVHVIANLEHIDTDGLARLNFVIFTKRNLSQVSQRGQVVVIQMASLAARQLPPLNFLESQLGSGVPIPLKRLYLSNVAGAGLDDCHRNSLASLIEYLRHANFLT